MAQPTHNYDEIDAFYDGTFDESVSLAGVSYRGIVESVRVDEPPFPGGRKERARVRVRIRRSELETRPPDRSVFTTENGSTYRMDAATLGSSGKEWLIECVEEP